MISAQYLYPDHLNINSTVNIQDLPGDPWSLVSCKEKCDDRHAFPTYKRSVRSVWSISSTCCDCSTGASHRYITFRHAGIFFSDRQKTSMLKGCSEEVGIDANAMSDTKKFLRDLHILYQQCIVFMVIGTRKQLNDKTIIQKSEVTETFSAFQVSMYRFRFLNQSRSRRSCLLKMNK